MTDQNNTIFFIINVEIGHQGREVKNREQTFHVYVPIIVENRVQI